jgi:hypothetical protein
MERQSAGILGPEQTRRGHIDLLPPRALAAGNGQNGATEGRDEAEDGRERETNKRSLFVSLSFNNLCRRDNYMVYG